MGLFSFLKSDKPAFSDKVWISKEAALKGIMTEALQVVTHADVPIILSFFSDKQHDLTTFANEKNIPYTVIEANSLVPGNRSVLIMNAQWLVTSAQAMDFLLQQFKTATTHLLFYGHYPIPGKENALLNKIKDSVNQENEIRFFSSLDDRAFKMFDADNIRNIMEKMGMKKDEAIEHPMVTKSMARAREKIAAGVAYEITAASESVWYQKNYSV